MSENEKVKLSDWYTNYAEAVGLFYGGYIILCGVIGGIFAFWMKGGVGEFLNHGWIYALIGITCGILIGLSLGLITNGILVYKGAKYYAEK